jgi:predicted nucleotidyltransferase
VPNPWRGARIEDAVPGVGGRQRLHPHAGKDEGTTARRNSRRAKVSCSVTDGDVAGGRPTSRCYWGDREGGRAESALPLVPGDSTQRKPVGGTATLLMSGRELVEAKREAILRLADQHGASNIRLLGSAARGEAGPASDVDLLVKMEEGRSLLDLVAFGQDMEELLGCRVDVITDGGVSPYLRDRIYAEAVPL